MGTTTRLLLPYPELTDPANVPGDVKRLADRIEAIIGGPLPQPIHKENLTSQNITATSPGWSVLTPLTSLANPHPSLYLLVLVTFGLWVDAKGNVVYSGVKSSGQTALAEVQGSRIEDTYASTTCLYLATVAPGAMLSAQPQSRRLNTSTTPTAPSARVTLQPTGWLTSGVINS